jgi:hypothetical protein
MQIPIETVKLIDAPDIQEAQLCKTLVRSAASLMPDLTTKDTADEF